MTRQSSVFDSLRLRENLTRSVVKNCKMEIREDGARTASFRGLTSVSVSFAPPAMRALSGQLYDLIPLNGSLSANLVATHMLQVAIIVGQIDLIVVGLPRISRQIEFLRRRISTDFALICALSLADAHGYEIHLEISQWEVMHSALSVKDDDSLIQKFGELLGVVQSVAEPGCEAISSRGTERVLSPVSYANLASLASAENWDDSVIRTLIEEYLSPTFHSGVAYYSNTVSGDEWRQLYDSLCGLFENAHSSRRSHRVRDHYGRNW
jgi:DNA-binding transcriptional LysR family regulator